MTNVLPSQRESFNYHQGRNEVLIQFVKDLLSRVPVRRTCEKLDIASGTYYSKLEWVYRKCLEFLHKNEYDAIARKTFNEIWLGTDSLIYNLNNIRLKGKGGKKSPAVNDKKLPTYLIASADIKYPYRGDNPILSPLADKDEGKRLLNCITDTTVIPNDNLARLLIQVNNRAVNNFFQEIRRRVSILERPLVTARGDGKSYIYSNYNPKYAQYATTIFRTFYNFCWSTKTKEGLATPAQRLGIANKVFDIKDIVYLK